MKPSLYKQDIPLQYFGHFISQIISLFEQPLPEYTGNSL